MEVKVQGEPVNPAEEERLRAARESQPETKGYRLKRGFTHGSANAGDEVQLTDGQYAAFADRFEPLDKDDNPVRRLTNSDAATQGVDEDREPTDEEKKAAAVRPVPTSHTPQDIGAKTLDPSKDDPNVGNRTRGIRPPAAMGDGDTQGIPPIRDNAVATHRTGGQPDPAVFTQPSERPGAQADKPVSGKVPASAEPSKPAATATPKPEDKK